MLTSYFHAATLTLLLFWVLPKGVLAQTDSLHLQLIDESGAPIPFATVAISGTTTGTVTNDAGQAILPFESTDFPLQLSISCIGYTNLDTTLLEIPSFPLSLKPAAYALDDVVVSGTLSPTLRTNSPVPVEVYTRTFLLADPTPSLFDALQNVNGVRPQVNCSVCNTGDIHINGLEGPYTMVTIDGMPIVSGLATVYGLVGIPNSMIERVEIVKGPAGALYGSEAMGGLINVITRDVDRAPQFSIDAFSSVWGDATLDLGLANKVGKHAQVLTSANGYFFDRGIDRNGDNFTDQTRAQRISVFQKWKFSGGDFTGLQLAGRALFEHRSGGELDYDPSLHRGSDVKYGESIDTRRTELLARYDVPVLKGLAFQLSANLHTQRSDYGTTPYDGDQAIAFGQATYQLRKGRHELLVGAATRFTYYDDNTFATADATGANRPDNVVLPGVFIQDEWAYGRHRLLAGMRYDHDPRHGSIWTPRIAYKLPAGEGANLRLGVGSGFRVVNLFTEDHAALSGAREVVINADLAPERSVSFNANFDKRWRPAGKINWTLEASAWYTRFSNQIIPDYETDISQIRYDNLAGYSFSRGASAELRADRGNWRATVGITGVDVQAVENDIARRPLLTEQWSGVWSANYTSQSKVWSFDYTSSLYGPMLLPVQGELDPRPTKSPWFSLQNIQCTYSPFGKTWELYGGIKNLLDFTPRADAIARSHDPFDRQVSFDSFGNALPTAGNPEALVFDPSYVYASNVGRRVFLGIRAKL